MPAELNNSEGMFPGHYDTRYEHTRPGNPDEGTPSLDKYLQSMALEVLGRSLSQEDLFKLKNNLDRKGLLYQNKGDESFRDEVFSYIKKLNLAKKVARKWLI